MDGHVNWRAFKLLNASERDRVAQDARGAAAAWATAWLGDAAVQVRCSDAGPGGLRRVGHAQRWLGCTAGDRGDAAMLVALDAAGQRTLAQALLGAADGRGTIAGSVAESALNDLCRRLLGAPADAVVRPVQQPAPLCWLRGSGAALLEIELGACTLTALATPAWVAQRLVSQPPRAAGTAAPARRAAPEELLPAIAKARVTVQVQLGGVALDLGLLQTLASGDVLRLDSRVDQPLGVTVQQRDTGRRAYLGRLRGARAVQLAAPR